MTSASMAGREFLSCAGPAEHSCALTWGGRSGLLFFIFFVIAHACETRVIDEIGATTLESAPGVRVADVHQFWSRPRCVGGLLIYCLPVAACVPP